MIRTNHSNIFVSGVLFPSLGLSESQVLMAGVQVEYVELTAELLSVDFVSLLSCQPGVHGHAPFLNKRPLRRSAAPAKGAHSPMK